MMDESEMLLREGIKLLSKMKFSKAEKKIRKAIDLYSQDAGNWLYLGHSCIFQGKFDDAYLAYENAVRHNPDIEKILPYPDDSEITTPLSTTLDRARTPAIPEWGFFGEVANLVINRKDSPTSKLIMKTLYEPHQNNLRYQYEMHHSSLRLDPERIETRYGLGMVLFGLGRFREAILEFGKVLEDNPRHWNAHRTFLLCFGLGGYLKWREVFVTTKKKSVYDDF